MYSSLDRFHPHSSTRAVVQPVYRYEQLDNDPTAVPLTGINHSDMHNAVPTMSTTMMYEDEDTEMRM